MDTISNEEIRRRIGMDKDELKLLGKKEEYCSMDMSEKQIQADG